MIKRNDLKTIKLLNDILIELGIKDCTAEIIPVFDRPICSCCNTAFTVGIHSKSIGNLAFLPFNHYSSSKQAYKDFKETILRASLGLGFDDDIN